MEDLETAAQLIVNAKYPVIISGGGVSQADALAEVKALVRALWG
jgi:sulfoacetaldehyde acetyltransferase